MTTVNSTAIWSTPTSVPSQDCDPLLDSVAAKVMKTVAYSTLLLLSLVGNSVVPAVVYRNPELHTNINYIIANMSVSDVLLAIFALPERIKQVYVPQAIWQIDGVFGAVLCKLRVFISDTSIVVTVLSLVLISFERFFAVVCPFKPQPIRSKRSCHFAIAFTWIFSMLYSALNFYTWRLEITNSTTLCVRKWKPALNTHEVDHIQYFVFQICFSAIHIVAVTSFCCAIIVSLLRKKTPDQRKWTEKKYRRITYMLLTVIAIYFVPWFGITVYVFLQSFVWEVLRPCSKRHVTFIMAYLGYSSSAFNPYCIFNCIFNARYRKGFRKILCCSKNMFSCKSDCTKANQEMPEEIAL